MAEVDYAAMVPAPEDMARNARSLDWLLREYEKVLTQVRDALPGRVNRLVKQEWAVGISEASAAKVRKEVMAHFGPHWEGVQIMLAKSARLGKTPKIKERIKATVLQDYSQMANTWRLFDVMVPNLVRRYADRDVQALSYQDAIKSVTEAKGWQEVWRFALVAELPESDEGAVRVWHAAGVKETYPVSRAHFDEHWDASAGREFTEQELEWGGKVALATCPRARVYPPRPSGPKLELGYVKEPFIGPDGTARRNCCIVLSHTGKSAGAGTDGTVKTGDDSSVFESSVLHALRVSNEFNFYHPDQWAQMRSAFGGMLGDTAMNLVELNDELNKAKEERK